MPFIGIRSIKRRAQLTRRKHSYGTCPQVSTSELDRPLCLFHNFALNDITKFQRVHNSLASIVTRSSRFSLSTQLPNSLHWLPIRYRLLFTLAPAREFFSLTMLRQHSQYDSRLGFSFRVLVRVMVMVRLGLG